MRTDVFTLIHEAVMSGYRRGSAGIAATVPDRVEVSPSVRDAWLAHLASVEKVSVPPTGREGPAPEIPGLEYVNTFDGAHIYCNPAFAFGVVTFAKLYVPKAT